MDDIACASTTQAAPSLSEEQQFNEFREIVWGQNIRLDVFQRWSQGLFINLFTIYKYYTFHQLEFFSKYFDRNN